MLVRSTGRNRKRPRLTDRPQIRYFTRRVIDLEDHLEKLTKPAPNLQCVFTFLRTRVDANWGATGAVHCIRAEQISDYVTKGRGGKPIIPAEVPRLVKAAEALRTLATESQKEDRAPTVRQHARNEEANIEAQRRGGEL